VVGVRLDDTRPHPNKKEYPMQSVSFVVTMNLPDGIAERMGEALQEDINESYSVEYPVEAVVEVAYVRDVYED
jgi:hypothetical protein